MEFKTYGPEEQVDPAEDLGVIPRRLPELEHIADFIRNAPKPPPQIIGGILHQGCKMVLGGTSKSNKSWCLLDLALSVSSGQRWWGRPSVKMPVVYINFELQTWAIWQRIQALCGARLECKDMGSNLGLWELARAPRALTSGAPLKDIVRADWTHDYVALRARKGAASSSQSVQTHF